MRANSGAPPSVAAHHYHEQMQCPYCQSSETRVIDSRPANAEIRRRRSCEDCARRFTTYEKLAEVEPMVVKRDGRREPFQRKKLRLGLGRACAKRAVPQISLDEIVAAIERRVRQSEIAEVESRQLGDWAVEHLISIDPVAGFRFAAVFRRPTDLDEIRRELAAAEQAARARAAVSEEWDQPPLPGLATPATRLSAQGSRKRDQATP